MGLLHDLIFGAPDVGSWTGHALERAARAPAVAAVPDAGDDPAPRTMADDIATIISQRVAAFTLADAMRMPAVIRGVQLLCSQIAQFRPVAYRDGVPVPDQPRILTQPAPFGTRYQFFYQTVYSLIAVGGERNTGGDAYWLVTSRDDQGIPNAAIVIDPREVTIEWDADHFLPVYRWRDRKVGPGGIPADNFVHLTIGRPPGELHGRSPLVAGLASLAVVDAAERYALGFFHAGGIPSVVFKLPGKGSPEEAARWKAQWMSAHSGPEPTPAVIFQQGGTVETEYPTVDAQKAQLQEARAYGATITGRLLGIPAPLLHIETSGATITYVSAGGALDDLVRTTALPVYGAPLEAYLAGLLPRTQTVRLDTGELNRIDIAGRFGVYQTGIAAGVMTAQEARVNEGWPTDAPIESVPAFAATPALSSPPLEVPARV